LATVDKYRNLNIPFSSAHFIDTTNPTHGLHALKFQRCHFIYVSNEESACYYRNVLSFSLSNNVLSCTLSNAERSSRDRITYGPRLAISLSNNVLSCTLSKVERSSRDTIKNGPNLAIS
jgi:hypothetical protein